MQQVVQDFFHQQYELHTVTVPPIYVCTVKGGWFTAPGAQASNVKFLPDALAFDDAKRHLVAFRPQPISLVQ